ncbi:MAG: O-antigen ligase family protein [Acidobacteriia bacterium]|nr:O-antigen ligase family protein [Terriglobia bacterium]
MIPPLWLRKVTLWLAIATAGSILLGVAWSQILMGVTLVALLLSGLPMRWPRIARPLALFLIWTLIALGASPDPVGGLAQVRKIYVFFVMLVVFSAVTEVRQARWLALTWMGIGTVTAGRGIFQYVRDIAAAKEAGVDFYHFYIGDRISGFMSHWMTFSGQELFVLLLLASFFLFAPDVRKRLWVAAPCGLIVFVALVASDTRSIWIAAVTSGAYLLWHWRKWAVAAMPVALGVGLLFAPTAVKMRVKSIVSPEKQTDSNQHRIVCWRTGWQMIKAHPVLGLGPDEIQKEAVFYRYLPADISKPLPEGYYKHLHNFYIQYAAERGIPATIFITAALLLSAWRFRKALGKLPPGRSDEKFLLHAGVAVIIGTLVAGVFEYNLNDTEVLTMFLSMICIGETCLGETCISETAAAKTASPA